MAASYDVVVAGGGHNSLTASAYLATAGLKVLVLERNPWLGGGVVTQEIVAPGFRHDLHSTAHMLIQANPLIQRDELGLLSRYGLKYIYPEITEAAVFDNGSTVLTYYDLDKTCESIARISEHDAEAYRKHVLWMRKLLPMFVSGLFAPPLPFGTFLGMLEQSREGRALIGVMNKSAYDLIDDIFENSLLKIHFMEYSAEAMAGPEEKGTGLIFSMLVGFVHSFHGGFPVSGTMSLTNALARCIEDHGGELRTGCHVSRVIVEGGRATGVALDTGEVLRGKRAVIGCFHPHLLDHYVAGVDPDIIADAKKTQPGPYSSMLVNYALNAEPVYRDMQGIPPALVYKCLPSNFEEIRREFDCFRYGRMPEQPSLILVSHSRLDPTRAPPGKATLYMYHFAPYDLEGNAENWSKRKHDVADWLLEHYRRFTTNMGPENIIGRHVTSPLEFVQNSLSFQRGDISGIGRYLYQFLGRRPTPELSRYAVPGVEGLYLSGPFMHPGGGVIGGGRATAVKILDDLHIDFEKAIAKEKLPT